MKKIELKKFTYNKFINVNRYRTFRMLLRYDSIVFGGIDKESLMSIEIINESKYYIRERGIIKGGSIILINIDSIKYLFIAKYE